MTVYVYDGRGKSKATQMDDVNSFASAIKVSHGIDVELVLNEAFQARLTDLRAVARKTEAALECPTSIKNVHRIALDGLLPPVIRCVSYSATRK